MVSEPVFVYRIQTLHPSLETGLPKRLGMCADATRAEEWRHAEEVALGEPVIVVQVHVDSPVWAMPDFLRITEEGL